MTETKTQLQFLGVLLAGILVLSFFVIKPFLLTIILAGIFAIVLQPLNKKIVLYTKGQKTFASFATLLIAIVCIIVPLFLLSSQIFKESVQLYNSLAQGEGGKSVLVGMIEAIGKLFETSIPSSANFFATLSNNVDVYLKQALSWLIQHLGVAFSSISGLLVDLFIFFVSLYYFLRDGNIFVDFLLKLSPLDKQDTQLIFKQLHTAVNSVIKGTLLIALLQGVLTAIGFLIFGVPSALLWGTVAVLAALIPGIGAGIVILPGILYLFVTGGTFETAGLALWAILAVGLADNLLRPKLVGGALELHSFIILLSVIGGLLFFGATGLFLGPIIVSLLSAFINTYGDLIQRLKK